MGPDADPIARAGASPEPIEGVDAAYALVQYASYLADPASLDPAWRRYFETHGPPGDGRAAVSAGPSVAPGDVAAAMDLAAAYRRLGHLAARLDPLGDEPPGDPALAPEAHGLTLERMAAIPAASVAFGLPGESLADVLPRLQGIYAGTIAYEFEHVASHRQREWLRRTIESGVHRAPRPDEERLGLLRTLTAVEALERFLGSAYLGQKRFSIEGLDVLVPMLDLLVELAATDGAREVVLGMAHRGRLDVLAHVVGVPLESILAEFEAGADLDEGRVPRGPTDDVKYHYGASGTRRGARGAVVVNLLPNPSHLEAVDPVVMGRVRGLQTERASHVSPPQRDRRQAVAVLVHGDAAFAAQGVVAETFNLARLAGYTIGGTLHLIANNQLGFTTTPAEARTTDFASDLAKGFDVPIIHVNADDPDACLAAVRLAAAYHAEFESDVVIDLVGYRRHGHNEGDEPAYTQPVMAARIAATPPVRAKYAALLASEGVVDAPTVDAEEEAAFAALDSARDAARKAAARRWTEAREPRGDRVVPEPATAVPARRLATLTRALLEVPESFTVHPKLVGQIDRRRHALDAGESVDWALAEALALASLLADGVPVRLSGQDTERGTFSQRHLAFFDAQTGARYAPIEHLRQSRASFEVINSPLSEFACLGFEYGYTTAASDTLVAWEAQYGDFVNEAEVIVDQFIVAGKAKWGQASSLTLLLPHGFEGQGPEHSSARLERFLALCANGNMRVAVPSTSGQYFHLLRRQALHPVRRPLIVMTPKSLLRARESLSSGLALSAGGFAPVLGPEPSVRAPDRHEARRVVLCSGKLFYDLVRAGAASGADVAVARIELLYPFPGAAVRRLLATFPKLESVVWAQEEPRNMGALKFVLPELLPLLPEGVALESVARPERSSPAEGYGAAHRAQQRRIVRDALSFGRAARPRRAPILSWR